MEEILFRGFNLKNGKWLYGFYLQNRGSHFVCPDEFADGKSWEDYEVCPETVGQYTGLKDKNGKKIFEGDIVEVYDFTSVYASKYRGVVKIYRGSWCVEYDDSIFDMVAHPKLFFDDFADRKTEVIGNIHDNPELLNK